MQKALGSFSQDAYIAIPANTPWKKRKDANNWQPMFHFRMPWTASQWTSTRIVIIVDVQRKSIGGNSYDWTPPVSCTHQGVCPGKDQQPCAIGGHDFPPFLSAQLHTS